MGTRIQITLRKFNGAYASGTVTVARSGYPTQSCVTSGSTCTVTVPGPGEYFITAKSGSLKGGPVNKTAQLNKTVNTIIVVSTVPSPVSSFSRKFSFKRGIGAFSSRGDNMHSGPAYQDLPPEFKIRQTKVLFGKPSEGIVYEEGFGSQGSNSMPNKYNWRQRGYNYGSDPVASARGASSSVIREMLHNTGDHGIPTTTIRRSKNIPTINTKIENRVRTYPKGYANMRQATDASRLARMAPQRSTVQTRTAIIGAMVKTRKDNYVAPQVHIGASVKANNAETVPMSLRVLTAQKQVTRDRELLLTKSNAMYHPSELLPDGTVRPDRVIANDLRVAIRRAQAQSGSSNGGKAFEDEVTQTSDDGTTNTFRANTSGSQANEGLMQYGSEASDYELNNEGGLSAAKKTAFSIIVAGLLLGGVYMYTRN